MENEEQDPNDKPPARRVTILRISDEQDIMRFLEEWAAMLNPEHLHSEEVIAEMNALEAADDAVQEESYPEIEQLIVNAYRNIRDAA